MKTKHTKFLFLTFICLGICISGCAPDQSTAVVQTEIPPTATIKPTKTLKPTMTNTSIPTQTLPPTVELTNTNTPVPGPDFTNAKVFSMGPMENWNFFFTIQIEEDITGEYYAMVDKNKKYKCFMHADYSNRLYCHGPQVAFNDFVEYELYRLDIPQPIHKGEFFIPQYLPPSK